MTSATAALALGRDVPAAAPADVFVDVRDVKLDYRTGDGSTLALDRTNMTLRRGEFVAIVGPSGCGKSSLLKLASGLRRPTEGEGQHYADEMNPWLAEARQTFADSPAVLIGLAAYEEEVAEMLTDE